MNETVALWITSGASVVGVIYAIARNGSRGKKQDEQLKTELKVEIKNINKKLDDPQSGLSAIKTAVEAQEKQCIKVSTHLEDQVNTNREEIAELRKKKKPG